jgi:hypothetical protein
MKLFRCWLVVLLAVVLPIKGAMAAAMLCPPLGSTPADVSVVAHDAGHSHGDMGHEDADHDHAAYDHAQHEHGKGSHDKCNLCSSSCSSPSMPSASAGLKEPEALTSQSFADLPAPAPTFLSDGQERPPRAI